MGGDHPRKWPMLLSPCCGANRSQLSTVRSAAACMAGPRIGCSTRNKNAVKHGRYRREAIAQRRHIAELINPAIAQVGVTDRVNNWRCFGRFVHAVFPPICLLQYGHF
jgi:hypothetical protein